MKTPVRPAVLWFTAALLLAVGLLAQWREESRLKALVLQLEQTQSQQPEPRPSEEVTAPTQAENTGLAARQSELEELRQARTELVEMQRRLQQLQAVATENEALRKELAIAQQSLTSSAPQTGSAVSMKQNPASIQLRPGVTLTDSPDTTLQEKIEAILCENHLKQITLAADLWAAKNDGFAPNDLMELQDYLAPMILVCPGTRPKSVALFWTDFDRSSITYRLRGPGVKWQKPSVKFVDCAVHQGWADNSPRATFFPARYHQ